MPSFLLFQALPRKREFLTALHCDLPGGQWAPWRPPETVPGPQPVLPLGDVLFPPLLVALMGWLCSERFLPFYAVVLLLPVAFVGGVQLIVVTGTKP